MPADTPEAARVAVPREPTRAMLAAAIGEREPLLNLHRPAAQHARDIYTAMIAAAPEAPASDAAGMRAALEKIAWEDDAEARPAETHDHEAWRRHWWREMHERQQTARAALPAPPQAAQS